MLNILNLAQPHRLHRLRLGRGHAAAQHPAARCISLHLPARHPARHAAPANLGAGRVEIRAEIVQIRVEIRAESRFEIVQIVESSDEAEGELGLWRLWEVSGRLWETVRVGGGGGVGRGEDYVRTVACFLAVLDVCDNISPIHLYKSTLASLCLTSVMISPCEMRAGAPA